ncbi:MAG TPA: Lrp/AsnC ligand binding domain-containing protein [Streptosporangiaceae bacterium]|nr:Lrp/AsnC ligand binding domain-containing protein [Streptosporangiaceae bacterium]
MTDAYVLIQTQVGKAAKVAASVQAVPGVSEAASVVGPYDVVARAQAEDMDKLARLVASQVRALDGVMRTITCTVVRL